MPRPPGAAIPGHYGSHRPLKSRGNRAPGKETEKQGAPRFPFLSAPSPSRYCHLPRTRPRTFSRPETHCSGLCSPGVGPRRGAPCPDAARRL